MKAAKLVGSVLFLALATSVTNAQSSTPALIKQYKDWGAYTYKESDGTVCFAISIPKKKLPKLPRGRKHGDVYFFVSAWKAYNAAAEPHFLVEYPFKKNSKVRIKIDKDNFEFFTQGQGAWAADSGQESRLVAAMKKGRKMVVTAQSYRGTRTTYEYSLKGVTAAIKAMGKACK